MGIIVVCGIFYPLIGTVKSDAVLSIGIDIQDKHPLVETAVSMVLSQSGLIQGIAMIDISNIQYNPQNFSCIVVIPQGFVEGVMNGQNPSPTLIINQNITQFEEIYIRELAGAAEGYLASTQAGIYAVINTAAYNNIGSDDLNKIVMEINSVYINQFLKKGNIISSKFLSPYDGISITTHIFTSVIILMFLFVGFLASGITSSCRRLAYILNRKSLIFMGSGMVCSFLIIFIPLNAVGYILKRNISIEYIISLALSALILTLFSMIIGLISPHKEGQLAIGGISTIGFMLLGGCIVPTSQMPPIFSTIELYIPTYYLHKLISGSPEEISVVVICISIMGILTAILWRYKAI